MRARTEVAAVESIRKGVKTRTPKFIKKAGKKLPPLKGNKKKPSSAIKAERKKSSSAKSSENTPRQFINVDGVQRDANEYHSEIKKARKKLGLDAEQPSVRLD